MPAIGWWLVGLAMLTTNAWATRRVLENWSVLTPIQRFGQLLITWALPIGGAIVIGSLHSLPKRGREAQGGEGPAEHESLQAADNGGDHGDGAGGGCDGSFGCD